MAKEIPKRILDLKKKAFIKNHPEDYQKDLELKAKLKELRREEYFKNLKNNQ